ncbi:Piezo-type mechanosensitive ion channel component 2 [Halotydeus destructor]|nr:Piezo-type mechanosensitive ion channel component 2 [Halotydeus destructor]
MSVDSNDTLISLQTLILIMEDPEVDIVKPSKVTSLRSGRSLSVPVTAVSDAGGDGLDQLPVTPSQERPHSIATTGDLATDSKSSVRRCFPFSVRDIFVKYWIWTVVIMLMIISITGQRVVIYRVVYMFFFLTFLLLFQLSYRLWRQTLYTFWISIIIYSSIVLVTIYSYQFKNFPMYWEKYLFISTELQRDLGLENFDKNPFWLFFELFTPTFLILITLVQIKFFHKDFLELCNYESRSPEVTTPSNPDTAGTSSGLSSSTRPTEKTPLKWSKHGQRVNLAAASGGPVSNGLSTGAELPPEVHIEVEDEVEEAKEYAVANETNNVQVRKASFDPSLRLDGALHTSCEPTQVEEASASFATPLSPQSPISKSVQLRPKTDSDRGPLRLDIRRTALDFRRRASGIWVTAKPRINVLYELVWRLLEIHMMKLIFISVLTVAVINVSAINFVFVILSAMALAIGRFQRLVVHLFGAWSAFLIITRMLYQLTIADYIAWEVNCAVVHGSSSNETYMPFNETIDNQAYLGFVKTDRVFPYIAEYLLIMLILTLHALVKTRQKIHRYRFSEEVPPAGILFLNNTRRDADNDFTESVKFILNYGFYKFGLEITCLAIIILIGYRVDVMSIIYSVFLFLFSVMRRRDIRRLWPLFTLLAMVSVPLQYAIAIGMPASLCLEYPWTSYIDPELRNWLFLPDFQLSPNVEYIMYDFVVLLLASRQLDVFRSEKSVYPHNGGGGSNAETYYDQEAARRKRNDVPDFFTYSKTFLDHLKSLFFSCFYWATLAVVFLTATGQKNLFGFGYLLGCFFFLWNGSEFYLKPIKTIIKTWKVLLAYTAVVMLLKTTIEILGCLFSGTLYTASWCWVAQLFGVGCKKKLVNGPDHSIICINVDTSACTLAEDASSIFWDGICFCFCLIQKRIFGSHYFSYLVKDIKAQQVLASRGAELIHEIQAKEVMEQEQAEKEVMEKIKNKMDRIRAKQQSQRSDKTKSHRQAVRSGDYYMFDDPESELIDFDDKQMRSLIPDPEGDELRRIANVRGISAFVSLIVKGVQEVEPEEATIFSGEHTDVGDSSKDSAIVSVDRIREVADSNVSLPTIVTSLPPSSSVQAGSSKEHLDTVRQVVSDQSVQDGDRIDQIGDCHEADKDEDKQSIESISVWEKALAWLRVFIMFIESCVISATAKLNHVSRDYRYVSSRLAVEKKALKLLFEMEEAEGVNYDNDWKKSTLEKISKASVAHNLNHRIDSVGSFKFTGGSDERLGNRRQSPPNGSEDGRNSEEGDFGFTFLNSNAFVRFFRSLFYTVVSQSEFVCFAMVILNQIVNASLLSLPLPMMVFLWGCLSVPRPSKTFWISLITYTEAVVVTKYVFHFRVWPWLDYSSWAPAIISVGGGAKESITATHIDLALLLFLFFHRFMLKSLGLWDLDISLERQKMKDAMDEQMQEEARRESHLAEASTSKNSLEGGEKMSTGLRKRKGKVISIDDKEPIIMNQEGDGVHEGSSDGRELGISVDVSLASKSAEEMSKNEELMMIQEDEDDKRRQRCAKDATMQVKARDSLANFLHPVNMFYDRLLHPPFRIAKDYYTIMFLCDFINFFIVVFGYNSFGSQGDQGIASYFEENRVPVPFLVMVLLQFSSIIIDRALYLRKNMRGRLMFHVLVIFVIHIWLFFVLPAVTERKFTDVMPPKVWYIFKSIYFLLSALQIKGGYPTRILGNTFTKKYSYINLYVFKGYIAVPFLYDMRLIMDWIWTDTSLELDEWSIMEDIFKNLFQRKCELQFQQDFPELRGSPRRLLAKYLLGGSYLVLMIGAIWFPLVIFAVSGQVGTENRPVDISIELEISGYVPIASMSKTKINASFLSAKEYQDLIDYSKFNKKTAEGFLSNYENTDTSLVKLNGKSTPVWGISPPSQSSLISDLQKTNNQMDLKITWHITRHKLSKTQNMDLSVYRSYDLEMSEALKTQFVAVLNGTSNQSVILPAIMPNFIRVPEKGEPDRAKQLDIGGSGYRDITVTLKKGQLEEGAASVQWWEVNDLCADDPFGFLKEKLEDRCNYVILILFNDRIFSGALQFISGYGILGLYTTFVFLMSRIIRGFFDDVSFKVIYTQMPNVDKVLQLCLDIYLVRESKEFSLEEDLFAKLLFLYRSPETLIKWTRDDQPPLMRDDH